jgi:hypothetical protein
MRRPRRGRPLTMSLVTLVVLGALARGAGLVGVPAELGAGPNGPPPPLAGASLRSTVPTDADGEPPLAVTVLPPVPAPGTEAPTTEEPVTEERVTEERTTEERATEEPDRPARTDTHDGSPEPVPPAEPAPPPELADTAAPPTDPITGADRTVGVPRDEPARLRIPAIAVDVGLLRLGLAADGAMELPPFGGAGWYVEGPRPGHPGPAVIVAHVDSREGPDVFFRLRELAGGEEVVVTYGSGDRAVFVVDHREQTPKDELPVHRIWPVSAEVRLTLVTCGGRFDREARSYEDNVIVYTLPRADGTS